MSESKSNVEKMELDDSDDDKWDSSDEEETKGPPPILNIEKSADLKAMKSAIMSAIERPASPGQSKVKIDIENRMGKENLSNLAHTFEELGKHKEKSPLAERQAIDVAVDKEQYSSFKEKFQNIEKVKADEMDEEKKAMRAAHEIQGLGADSLSKAKDLFDKKTGAASPDPSRKVLDIERSDADKKLIQKTFFDAAEKEEPKDCAICGKVVYPVEKILAGRHIFHKNCFNCTKCQKRLNVQNYSTHEGKIYCKLHALEILRPEIALAYEKGEITEGDIDGAEVDEEGDYVLTSKPKVHDSSVVRSGLKSTDDLETIGSLKNKKTEWAKSAEDSARADKKILDENEAKLFQQGRVKGHTTKFIEGDAGAAEDEEPEDSGDTQRDPNIIKSSKKKEIINIEVGAKSIKGKWEAGTVERAQGEMEDRSHELDEIKKNMSLKERFKEKADGQQEEEDASMKRKSAIDEEGVDTTLSHAAKELFLKGNAFQDTKPIEKTLASEDIKFGETGNIKERFEKMPLDDGRQVEKTVPDACCAELGGIKAAFEQAGKKTDDSAESARKKEQLADEFKEFKEARKQRKQADDGSDAAAETKEADISGISGHEMTSIKERFEAGPAAFEGARPTTPSKVDDVEIKIAGKAREKFRQIDKTGAGGVPTAAPATKTLEQSKWAKEAKVKPEAVNKRISGEDEEGENEPDDFEVKNLLNKFKNIEQGKADEQKTPRPKRQITPPPEGYVPESREAITKEKEIVPSVPAEELAGIKAEAKNLKAKFEQKAAEVLDKKPTDEEKKRQLEEEFKKLKELKEEQKQAEPEEPEPEELGDKGKDTDLALAAEHGQKSRAKWEKIERKEAKKAQKAAAAAKRPAQSHLLPIPAPEFCAVCSAKVYLAERFECDALLYHKPCFKCKHCGFRLRLENYAAGPDGIYCKTHYKVLFNDMSQTFYDGRKLEVAPMLIIRNSVLSH